MYVARMTFRTRKHLSGAEKRDAVCSVLLALRDNGQVVGREYPLVETPATVQAYVNLADRDALAPRHWSAQTKAAHGAAADAGVRLTTHSLDQRLPDSTVCRCRKPSSLWLSTNWLRPTSPIICGRCKETVPLYRLRRRGADSRLLADLLAWQLDFNWFDCVWLWSGEGEMRALRQLSNPNSDLARFGRDLCAEIESLTGVPMFYNLFFSYEQEQRKAKENACPICGKPWLRERGFHYEFECTPCRILNMVERNP